MVEPKVKCAKLYYAEHLSTFDDVLMKCLLSMNVRGTAGYIVEGLYMSVLAATLWSCPRGRTDKFKNSQNLGL